MENKNDKTLENVGIQLLKLYSQNKIISISFVENGYFNDISGMIDKIDFVEKQLVMIPSKKIPFLNILNINELS